VTTEQAGKTSVFLGHACISQRDLMSTEEGIQILDAFLLNQAILHFIWISETADYRSEAEGASRSIKH
jgi:hypothetical protein